MASARPTSPPTSAERRPLRVLLVEDSSSDAELVKRQLVKGGYDLAAVQVQDAGAFAEALSSGAWDVIVADYTVPGFGAVAALEHLKQSDCDIPFIIVSGTITDEMAADCMRGGAHDYVLKDNIARLSPAIARGMQEAATRRQKRQAERARQEAEAARRQSEQLFRTMTENVPEMIWVCGAGGRFLYLSPKWLEYTGTTVEQNERGGWANAIHPEDRPRVLQTWATAIAARSRFETEYRLRRSDGEYRWHLSRGVPISDPATNETRWFGITTDLHDQKRANQALIRSEKLASVGRMAATIAHEINNPLAAAINALFLVLANPAVPESARKHLELAEKELMRVAHLTKQTLGFYRDSGTPGPVDLPGAIDSVLDLYEPKLRNKAVSLVRQFHSTAGVEAVDGELRQIVSNLVANSIDALEAKATLQVRTSGPHLHNGDRPMVRLTIADNGNGIPAENLKRIFEPFFTTKEAVGTGLGLWVTSELVRKHDGRLRVRSRPGKGTVFSIWLPAERRRQQRDAA